MAQNRKSRDDEAVKTAQALRLIKAFQALESQPLRDALLVLTEALAACEGRRQ